MSNIKFTNQKYYKQRKMCGTMFVYCEREGEPPFCIAEFPYNYGYTSNSSQHIMADAILKLLDNDE